ncbi:Hypothetical protein CINCED_3A004971, partial [Cinara cedri]
AVTTEFSKSRITDQRSVLIRAQQNNFSRYPLMIICKMLYIIIYFIIIILILSIFPNSYKIITLLGWTIYSRARLGGEGTRARSVKPTGSRH